MDPQQSKEASSVKLSIPINPLTKPNFHNRKQSSKIKQQKAIGFSQASQSLNEWNFRKIMNNHLHIYFPE